MQQGIRGQRALRVPRTDCPALWEAAPCCGAGSPGHRHPAPPCRLCRRRPSPALRAGRWCRWRPPMRATPGACGVSCSAARVPIPATPVSTAPSADPRPASERSPRAAIWARVAAVAWSAAVRPAVMLADMAWRSSRAGRASWSCRSPPGSTKVTGSPAPSAPAAPERLGRGSPLLPRRRAGGQGPRRCRRSGGPGPLGPGGRPGAAAPPGCGPRGRPPAAEAAGDGLVVAGAAGQPRPSAHPGLPTSRTKRTSHGARPMSSRCGARERAGRTKARPKRNPQTLFRRPKAPIHVDSIVALV
jgi:hypothetical protein